MYKVSVPIYLKQSKNKTFSLNLNEYRNAHYQTLNNMKRLFKKIVAPDIRKLPYFKSIELTYVLYPKRMCDLANVCSIVDKFFCDAMVELNRLTDDNLDYLKRIHFEFGSIDKVNPRIDIYIKGKPMEFKLKQSEIEEALQLKINSMFAVPMNASFTFSIGRGENAELTATIDVVPVSEGKAPSKPKPEIEVVDGVTNPLDEGSGVGKRKTRSKKVEEEFPKPEDDIPDFAVTRNNEEDVSLFEPENKEGEVIVDADMVITEEEDDLFKE